MPIRPIVITGDPVLHHPAAPVTRFDDELRTLIDDMFETMDAAPGVGLAAPQVGMPLRVFVYTYDDGVSPVRRGSIVNPTLWITPTPVRHPDPDEDAEGCLSVPGERYPIVRSERAVLEGFTPSGDPTRVEADGWFARIFQHEYDHLEGALYVDRLIEPYHHQVERVIRHARWGRPGLTWTPGVDDIDA